VSFFAFNEANFEKCTNIWLWAICPNAHPIPGHLLP
jgi:hypothetical protein